MLGASAVKQKAVNFFSLKGSIKTSKPFDIKLMDKAVQEAIAKDLDKIKDIKRYEP